MTEDEMIAAMRKMRKSGLFSRVIVILVILLNIGFTAAIVAVFWHTGNEPGILVGAWFSFTTVELWSLARIRRDKIERGE